MSTPEPDRPADDVAMPWEVTLSGSCYFEMTVEVAATDREDARRKGREIANLGTWSFSGPVKVSQESALRISPQSAWKALTCRMALGEPAVILEDVSRAVNEEPKPTADTPSAAHIAAARRHLGLGEGDRILVRIHHGEVIACRLGSIFELIPYPPVDGRDVEAAE